MLEKICTQGHNRRLRGRLLRKTREATDFHKLASCKPNCALIYTKKLAVSEVKVSFEPDLVVLIGRFDWVQW